MIRLTAVMILFACVSGCDRKPVPVVTPPPVPAAPIDAQVAAVPEPEPEPELKTEDKEADPRSRVVRLKIFVSPAVRATVMWGRKKLGETRPGQQLLEFERPRSSGPLDLVVTSDGYLPHHVRLFTDRDDKLSIRLVRPTDASGLLGWRRGAAAQPSP